VVSFAWLASLSGCAGPSWPDEPGIPVELSQAANVQAGDAFLAALTARRRSATLPAPIVAPRYQSDLRPIAEDLQAGKTSAAGAERAAAAWGRAAYARDVATFLVDCAAGDKMEVPSKLASMPSAVISYAAAQFRPRSLPKTQCVVIVVAVVGAEPTAPSSL
jgi:hypothetical protein